ncbi:orotidine-5'-phosphate decarboxylase [Thiomicrospira microaerophila]|uniref:orotidine-5'-phosphate decarboxylase n=1 Tax=Thiomicrospira microaerophila TaxID=406020 RepID=UPI00200DBC61|nr:orotidine-5'-phosphate decarboxylase [Thiomicrospira microaerophila]UQB43109.1 orotidine-5'-phosphate decarboxylase [Thiomicrospira microaerophila]
MPSNRVIVALDYANKNEALNLVNQLDASQCKLKVGKELFAIAGPQIVETFVARGFDVFLDLKYHDIPNTVAMACKAAANMGVWMVNVHAMGGAKMISLAKEAIVNSSHQPILTAVTVLTSFDQDQLASIGLSGTIEQNVVRLAKLARDAGADGVVCSALEVAVLRSEIGKDFCLVTPGIRPAGSAVNDQNRIMTPAEAMAAGSDYLVIGRPITQAKDPLASLIAINESLG